MYLESELLDAQRLAHKLGLGILRDPPFAVHKDRCHHLENGCLCPQCRQDRRRMVERGFTAKGNIAGLKAKKAPAQPWEQAA